MPAVLGIPSQLRKKALTRAVRLYAAKTFNQFKCSQIFQGTNKERLRIYSEEEISWELAEYMRRLSNLRAQPGPAEQLSDTQIGKNSARTLYMAESFLMKSNDLITWKELGEGKQTLLSLQDLMAKKRRWVQKRLQQKVTKFGRTIERLSCQVLSEGVVTYKVSGVDDILDYKIPQDTVSTTWTDPTHDIIQEFMEFVDDFIEQAGGPPTKVITNHRFWSTYVKPNDRFNAFDIRASMLGMLELFLNATDLAQKNQRPEWVNISDRFRDESDTVQSMWPINKMTFIREDDEDDEAFEMMTARTLDNDNNGGLFSREVLHQSAPVSLEIFVTDNKMPVVRNNTKVKTFTLTV